MYMHVCVRVCPCTDTSHKQWEIIDDLGEKKLEEKASFPSQSGQNEQQYTWFGKVDIQKSIFIVGKAVGLLSCYAICGDVLSEM